MPIYICGDCDHKVEQYTEVLRHEKETGHSFKMNWNQLLNDPEVEKRIKELTSNQKIEENDVDAESLKRLILSNTLTNDQIKSLKQQLLSGSNSFIIPNVTEQQKEYLRNMKKYD